MPLKVQGNALPGQFLNQKAVPYAERAYQMVSKGADEKLVTGLFYQEYPGKTRVLRGGSQ